MKNRYMLSTIVFALIHLTPLLPAFGQAVGSVESITGDATVQRSANGATEALLKSSEIFLNDVVTTEQSAALVLRLADGATITLGENSSMTVDTYVYNPSRKNGNEGHIRLMKGLFKVVTDQITKLNPDRFKVSTSDGVIGIRGCAVGFDLTGEAHKVFVLDIHDVESVEIFLNALPDDPSALRQISINASGKGVILTDSGLQLFEFDPNEFESILGLLGAYVEEEFGDEEDDASTDGEDMAGDEGTGPGGEGEEGSWDESWGEDMDEGWVDVFEEEEGAMTEAELDELFGEDPITDENEDNLSDFYSEEDPLQEPEEEPSEEPQEEFVEDEGDPGLPPGTITEILPQVLIDQASGSYWGWEIWEETTLVKDEQGNVIDSFNNYFPKNNGTFTTPTDHNTLVMGTGMGLSGSGTAGAMVSYGPHYDHMSGTVNINVTFPGYGGVPSWNGTLALSSPNSTLNTGLTGSFTPNGEITATVNGYSLNTFGNGFGSPGMQHVFGRLSKNPTLMPSVVVEGAVFTFNFDHGPNNPRVTGAAGADL